MVTATERMDSQRARFPPSRSIRRPPANAPATQPIPHRVVSSPAVLVEIPSRVEREGLTSWLAPTITRKTIKPMAATNNTTGFLNARKAPQLKRVPGVRSGSLIKKSSRNGSRVRAARKRNTPCQEDSAMMPATEAATITPMERPPTMKPCRMPFSSAGVTSSAKPSVQVS